MSWSFFHEGDSMARAKTINTKGWTGAITDGQNVLGTLQAALVSISLPEASIRETLLRSRGQVSLAFGANAATDSDIVGLGLIVVHTNAVTAGGASLPGPIKDIGADWLWHSFVCMDAAGATAQNVDGILMNRIVEIDSKAMRRVPSDHEVVLMAELTSGDFNITNAQAAIRLLFGH